MFRKREADFETDKCFALKICWQIRSLRWLTWVSFKLQNNGKYVKVGKEN